MRRHLRGIVVTSSGSKASLFLEIIKELASDDILHGLTKEISDAKPSRAVRVCV